MITKTYNFNSNVVNRKSGKVVKELFQNLEKTFTISVREEADQKYFGFFKFELSSKGRTFRPFLDEKNNLLKLPVDVDLNQYLYFVNEDDKKDFIETLDTIKKEYYEAKTKLEKNQKEAQDYLKNNLKDKYEKIVFARVGRYCKFEIEDYAKAIVEAMMDEGIEKFSNEGIEIYAIPYSDSYEIRNITKEQLLKIVKYGEEKIKARADRVKARREAKEKRIADAIQKAKETGEAQIIASWTEECNNKNIDCDLDNVIEYVDGNGKRWTERSHSY